MASQKKIFGIGLPRTGTTSLARALDEYGIDTIHFPFDLYEEGLDAPVIEQHTAFVDTPIPMFYRELGQRWPGSKFILTVRDKADWLDSMEWLLEVGPKIWPWRPVYDEYNRDFFGTASFDPAALTRRYDEYHRDVVQYFEGRPRDLLTVDLSESPDTRRLVEFLELDQEPRPWPRTNTSRTPSLLQEAAYQVERMQWKRAGRVLRRIDNGIKRRLPDGD